MKKKETKNTLSLDPDLFDDQQEDLAMLLFHSVAPSYAFVDDLNHLYNIRLSRIDDLQLNDAHWPLFIHHDSLHQLHYYLVERPVSTNSAAPFWTIGHKMLIILGQMAADTAQAIHREFSNASTPDDPDDIIAANHVALLDEMRSNFTTTTLLSPSTPPPSTLRGKALRDYNELFDLIDAILDTLDIKYICDN
jgi:hypothetical protein